MPCRNRNKEMGKEVVALVIVPLVTAVMVANLFHRKKSVEAVV